MNRKERIDELYNMLFKRYHDPHDDASFRLLVELAYDAGAFDSLLESIDLVETSCSYYGAGTDYKQGKIDQMNVIAMKLRKKLEKR